VVLTRANADGSQGLKEIKELGVLAVVRDSKTAEIGIMPRIAAVITEVEHILLLC
jgi:chemotaxis response regulator CheB